MIVGTGIDAVNIQRVKHLDDAFVNRYFSEEEVYEYKKMQSVHEDVKAQFLASRFAAKEAFAKAVGTGFCSYVVPCEISVSKDKNGKPYIKLNGKTGAHFGEKKVHLSITHEEPLAIAFVVIEEA